MSIPKNHHYVSQCQQSEFFNSQESLIFIYDKQLNNFYSKKTTKSLFSETYLNSRIKKGVTDHSGLESELKFLEDDYPKHLKKIKDFIAIQSDKDATYESLFYITLLGILGELRHPESKKSLDSLSKKIDADIITKISILSGKKIDELLSKNAKIKYENIIGYLDTALRIAERMEPFDFEINYIETDDHFILPDTSCFTVRGRLHDYPNKYIREIVQIGIPISPKLFVLATSKHLNLGLSGIRYIRDNNSEIVYSINEDLYRSAFKAVVCQNEQYLKTLITKIKAGA